MKELLKITNLHANVGEKEILKGLDLTINKGETHVIMGPNGSGKSTTANVILNNPEYKITEGEIIFERSQRVHTDAVTSRALTASATYTNYAPLPSKIITPS